MSSSDDAGADTSPAPSVSAGASAWEPSPVAASLAATSFSSSSSCSAALLWLLLFSPAAATAAAVALESSLLARACATFAAPLDEGRDPAAASAAAATRPASGTGGRAGDCPWGINGDGAKMMPEDDAGISIGRAQARVTAAAA